MFIILLYHKYIGKSIQFVDSIKICIPQHITINSTNIKTWVSDLSYASTAVNGVKQATTTTAYANAVKNLSLRQAELALSTKNLSAEQQREILVTAGLIKETGTLTVAQATEALTTDTRNAADVEALMLKAGLITELGAETTATITVDAAKLKELVDTKVLTQAEAELLAMKAGVTLQSTKEAATLIASNAKLGSSFAIMGKTAGAALKGIGTGLLSFASAHPLIAALVGVVSIVGLVTTGTKKLREEQEQAIATARSLQEEYRSSTKSLSDNISSLESQKDEFERLSKGVDDYGKNISLSSDEYDRYKSIVAEILGYSPELIQGYDAEGNAIANKNSLIERSIELMKEEQRQKLKEMTTDEKTKTAYEGAKADWEQTKGYEGANTRNDIARWFNDNATSGGWNYEVDIAEILGIKDEWKEEGNNLQNAIINNIETVAKNIKEKKAELLALEDENGNALFTEAEIDAMIDQADTWQQQYADWQQDIEDAKHGMDDQFELYAQKADGYNDLTDAQKAFVNEYIKATGDIIDADGNLLSEDEIIKKAEGYTKFVEKLANDPNFEEARTKINTLFSLDKSNMSASEYEKQVNAILKELQDKFNLTDDEVMDFKISLGFTFTSDGKTQTGELLDQVKGKLKDEFDGKADELTLEELQIAAKIVADIPEGTLLSWDELQDKIKETQGNANEMTVSLKGVSDTLDELDKLFKAYEDDMELTADEVADILEEHPEYVQYLTKVGDKYKVNQKALEDWNKAKEEQQRLIDEQMGSNQYAEDYNPLLDSISDNTWKPESDGDGSWDGGSEALDDLIAKNKELNQSFAEGNISATDYFNSLSDSITDSGLEEALDDIGGKFDETTDKIEATVATLAGELSDAMIQASKRYELGKTSVGDYIDELDAGLEAQMKLLKSTYDLTEGVDDNGKTIMVAADNTDEAAKKAAESFNKAFEIQDDIDAVNEFADAMESYNDRIMQYVGEDNVSLTDAILGDVQLFNTHMDNVTDSLVAFAGTSTENFNTVSQQIQNSLGVNQQAAEDLIRQGGDAIQAAAGQNMAAINGLSQGAMENARTTITNASQAIGGVLEALGNAISNFDYTLTMKPEGSIDLFDLGDIAKGEINPTGEVKLNITGSGGKSIQGLSQSLIDAGNYFTSQGNNNAGGYSGYGSSPSTTAAGKRPSSGGSGGSGGGGSKKDPAEEQEKKELEELKNKLSMREKVLERYQKAVDITDYGLDLAEEDDFALRVDLLNNKLSQLTSYGLAMREEFDEIVSIIPKTSEQAEVLASTIESLSGDMRENVVAIRETKIAMEQLAIDAMASVGETHLKDLENELDTIERRIELLNKDNGEDYQYTNEILSMKMFLPTSSSSTKSRNSKREVDQDAIEAEQETSDIINDLVETQIEKNKELREDERQHLLENMEQMRADTQIVLQSAAIDYENHGAEVSATTDAFTTYITNTINNMKMVIPKPDTSNFEKAADDITGSIKRINELLGVTPGAYLASGTSFGNAKASDLGIAGENYKPEILVDKKTGALTYIDSPTAIDLTKTDVVGEKATAGLPMFAKGTIGDGSSSTAYLTERLYTGINNIIKGAKGYGAVGAARSYLDTPYVWGGTSRAGVDCSGLTYLAWQQMGVNIGRTTYDQYPNSTRVSAGQLRPGDLVFSNFGAMGLEGPGHVGMYIGHGRTIESPGTGSSVCISSLGKWTAYGRPRYATGTPYSAGGMALLGDDREGKLNKIRPELVITKHGARLVGTQGAEFVNLEKGDQVIPYDQTVEILKRSGKSVPRFATGTVDPMDIVRYIKSNYPEVTDAAIAGILGNIEAESTFDPFAWELDTNGKMSGGLFQMQPDRIPNIGELAKKGDWKGQIDTAFANGRSGSGIGRNVWNEIWTNPSLTAREAARQMDRVFERSGGTKLTRDGNTTAQRMASAEKYYSQITGLLGDIASNTEEEKDPRKAKTEEVQKMADEYAERIGKVTLNGRALAQGIYNNKDLTNIEKTKQLYDVYKPMAKESAKIGSEMYATALESYNNWLKDVEADPSLYSKETDDAYRDLFADIEDYTYEYEERLVEMRETIVSNIVEPYERAISLLESRSAQLDGLMQNAETRGLMMSTRYYEKMKDVEQQKLDDLVAQRDELSKFIDEGVLNGDIEVGSSYWHELQNQVNGYTESIIESTNALAEHDNQMRQVLWDRFDYFSDSFSHLTDESNFLIELIGDNLYHNDEESIAPILDEMKTNSRLWFGKDEEGQKRLADANSEMAKIVADITGQDLHRGEDGVWYIDDQELYSYRDGQLSGTGMAVMGLRGMNYNVYMEKALSYAHELEKIENDIANNPNDINLIARKQELLELQREAVLAAEAEKDAIVALVEEGITLELESLQKLIDKYTESIEKTKSLYEYQEKLTDQTKDVAKIEKQLAAYENDDSEETRTKVQKLKLDLEKAQDNLKDTEYDKYINDQKKMLEDLYKYYEKALTQKLENTDGIVQDVVDGVNENANVISNVINRETTKVGASVSQSMGNIWNNENRVLKTYFEDDDSLLGGFKLAADGYFEAMTDPNTGVLAVLGDISTGINNMLEDASNKGKTEEESDFNKKQMIKNTIDWWGATDKQRENLSKENSIIGESMNLHIGEDGKWYDNDGDLAYEDPISNSDKIKALIARIRQNELDAKVSNDKGKEELEKSSNVRREQIDEILSQKMSSKEKNEIAQTLADIMNENSLDWSISDSGGRDTLSGMNSYIAGLVQTLTGKTMSNTNGVWTLDGESFLDKYGHSTRDVDIASRLSEIRDIIDGIRQNELDSLVSNDEGKDKLAADSASKKDKLSELIEDEYSDAERDRIAKVIVSRMERNVADWGVSDDNGKAILEAQNEYLAEVLSDLLKSWIKKDEDGVWKFGDEQLFTKYASGGLADYTGLAWLDGTPSKPELVLNAKDTQNFINLKDALEKASVQGMLSNLTAIPDFYNGALQNNSYKHLPISSSMGDVNFNIDIEHVEDYNDFVSQLQKDKKFERMIQSMSVDLLAGKSSLAKNKYKW